METMLKCLCPKCKHHYANVLESDIKSNGRIRASVFQFIDTIYYSGDLAICLKCGASLFGGQKAESNMRLKILTDKGYKP